MAELVLTLTTGTDVLMEVEDGAKALKALQNSHTPFGFDWVQVDDDTVVSKAAIVSARVAGDPVAPYAV
jgi:hypothetical protein